jgi:hypothetical protein
MFISMLGPVLIPIVFFIATAIVINNVLKYKIQRRIVEAGQIDESIIKALLKPAGLNHDALKWGLLALFGGLGLVVLEFLPYETNSSPLPFGIEAVFLSIGFLLYYGIVRRQERHS